MAYEIDFSPDAIEHLSALRPFEQRRIADSIETQLRHEPLRDSRHRKPMRSNLVATRELRVGDYPAYYDVDQSELKVLIRAIGVKTGSRVFIGGEEVDLP
jgi:mRNA-degrading endonuclease RelE of RelBE toxin-antitoxin system